MDKNVVWYIDKRIERTMEGLRRRNMEGYCVEDEAELIGLLKQLTPPKSVVGVGDSMTLFETGVIDFLRKGDFVFLDKYRDGITSEEKREIYIKNFSADTFLCSTNALTEDGSCIILTGTAAGLPYHIWAKQVILVAGSIKSFATWRAEKESGNMPPRSMQSGWGKHALHGFGLLY